MIKLKFLVLDGNSILNRAFYGIRMLSNKKGQMTNGIYGFLSTLQKLTAEVNPQRVAIAFDLPSPTFRHKMYENYKITRKKMPEELFSQLPILKELLVAMGYKLISCEGYEADDILGTFAGYCEKNGFDCVLATGDRDSLQLVSKKTLVRIAVTKFGKAESELYDEEKIKEVYKISPSNLIDIKALQGDASDNIPGVKGIGEKTAKELISQFKSIDYIYNNIDTLNIKDSVKNKLIAGKDLAYLSYELGKIIKTVPIEINQEDYLPKPFDSAKVKKMMVELEFFSLLKKMDLSGSSQSCEAVVTEEINCDSYKEILREILSKKSVNFFTHIEDSQIHTVYICGEPKIYVLKNSHTKFHEFLKQVMECESLEKATYNIKNLHKALEMQNIELLGDCFDVMLAAYLLNPSEKTYDITKIADIYSVALPSGENNSNNAYLVKELKPVLEKSLAKNNQLKLLTSIEQPLAKVLANMENIGFEVDKKGLSLYGENLAQELEDLKKSIYSSAGCEFNINSPKQLGHVLFEKLGLPTGKKGKTGYSTNATILENLRGKHEVIDSVLNWRVLSKLKSTYCDAMVKLITPQGRIHTFFNQTETRTGRISSAEPNLQNIPVRTPRGRMLRKFFGAKPGYVLIDADYSQIELRILAHISEDENMINAFKNEEDIHAITASQILGVPLGMITPEMRFRAKAVNFGIIYGMGAFSLSQDLKISRFEAQNYINRYLSHYRGVDSYMHNIIEKAKSEGFVETMFSRRRYLPELNSANHTLRAFGERVARNMPIQGSAADIIKIAMINVFERLKNKKSKLVLQVHDELIIEALESEASEIKKILEFEMENAAKLSVPLKVHVAMGGTWLDAKN